MFAAIRTAYIAREWKLPISHANYLKIQTTKETNKSEISHRYCITRIFYKKLKSGAGRQFLKFSGYSAIKSFLHVSQRSSVMNKRAPKVK